MNFQFLQTVEDNPTAGGVGDRADVLEALIKDEIEGVFGCRYHCTRNYK